MKARVRNDSLELTRVIWDLCLLVMLRQECGFGQTRMKRFYEQLEQTQAEFTKFACATDKKPDSYTNIDSAIIKMMHELTGVDWKDILGIEQLVINGKDLTKIVDAMNAREDSIYGGKRYD